MRSPIIAATLLSIACAACTTANATGSDSATTDKTVVALGRKIFFDSTLSASGRISCASCHNPAHAYAPANGLAVQFGGPALNVQGARAVPSLRYALNRTPVWYKEYVSSIAERAREGNEPPAGGFGEDGRFNSLHDQAAFPLLAPNEMANHDSTDVVSKLKRASYAGEFRRVFGGRIFDVPEHAFTQALHAVERFELEDPSFHPYDSKYDRYLDGVAALTAQERRGLALFDDPRRGNCSACHLDEKGADGSHPLFTDYQFEALGVPRNSEIRANRDSTYFDEGLCGPARQDQRAQRDYCGMFKTPTLRNVATRGAFFHNGRFHTLKAALQFYVGRDADAERWYPRAANGRLVKFNDLPPDLRGNADTVDLPLTRHAGQRAVWSDAEIDDVIAFLATLNDADVTSAGTVVASRRP
ncbi:MAG TPA: cytochrome c peroxidase [Gemmatimonadaceae bacterium]|jgi:cytochrome c peroxidase